MRHPFTFACVTAAVLSAHATTGAQPPYADTEWTTIHATSRNNDYVPTAMAERYERKWKVLLVADVVKMRVLSRSARMTFPPDSGRHRHLAFGRAA